VTARLQRISPAVLLLISAALVSAVALVALQSHLTFFLDDWDLLLHRRGFDADVFLRPHNEHIVIGPAIVYKALQATLGMDSPAPYQALSIGMFIASVALLFVWVRRRLGEWWALLAAVAILFCGAAFEDLLSAFQIGYFGSMTGGLAALLALERPSRRNDVIACAALVVACAFSSVGVPFLAGAAIAAATGPRPVARAWIVAVPAILFALWWLGWGSESDTHLSFDGVAKSPEYLLAGLANGVAALLGLGASSGTIEGTGLEWGRVVLFSVGALAVWRARVAGVASRWLWVVLAILVSFWLLAAINAVFFRPPTAPRYIYISAILTLMVAAELLRGVQLPNWALGAGFAITALAIGANAVSMRDGYTIFEEKESNQRAGITAIELARDTVAPDFLLTEENSDAPFFDYVDAASYLSAVDAFGSPAYTEAELGDEAEHVRVAADKALAAAERIDLADGAPPGTCDGVDPTATDENGRAYALGPGTYRVTATAGGTSVAAQRYSTSLPVRLGQVESGAAATFAIPADRATPPWAVRLDLAGEIAACG
jgi:hypothetical protein